MAGLPILLASSLLAAVSITEVGLVSSMVGFLHQQKTEVKTYQVNWPNNAVTLNALPAHLLVDQGHTTNGAAGYGFVLGVAGILVALHQRKRNRDGPSKSLLALAILLLLSTLLSLAALIYTFVVTNQTKHQTISSSIAQTGAKYPSDNWTPENWYKALLNVPLDDDSLISTFKTHIRLMEAWRWMLIPLFIVDVLALGVVASAVLKQRKKFRYDSQLSYKVVNSRSRNSPAV